MSFPSHKAHRAALISVSSALRHQFTLPDHGYGASASRGVPVYVPSSAGTHCTYPRRDGQAELTWVGWSYLYRTTLAILHYRERLNACINHIMNK